MREDPEMVPGLPSVAGDEEVEEAVGTAEEEAETEDESLFMILLPRYKNIFRSKCNVLSRHLIFFPGWPLPPSSPA